MAEPVEVTMTLASHRPREEIEQDASGWNTDGTAHGQAGLHNQTLCLEVLLDIRDLLARAEARAENVDPVSEAQARFRERRRAAEEAIEGGGG